MARIDVIVCPRCYGKVKWEVSFCGSQITSHRLICWRCNVSAAGPDRQAVAQEFHERAAAVVMPARIHESPDPAGPAPDDGWGVPSSAEHAARGRCSCSFRHPPHDWCDGNPRGVPDGGPDVPSGYEVLGQPYVIDPNAKPDGPVEYGSLAQLLEAHRGEVVNPVCRMEITLADRSKNQNEDIIDPAGAVPDVPLLLAHDPSRSLTVDEANELLGGKAGRQYAGSIDFRSESNRDRYIGSHGWFKTWQQGGPVPAWEAMQGGSRLVCRPSRDLWNFIGVCLYAHRPGVPADAEPIVDHPMHRIGPPVVYRDAFGNRLPRGLVRLSLREFDALPEYSASMPTGLPLGKRWKRDVHAYVRNAEAVPLWLMGEVVEVNDGDALISWSRIEVIDPLP